MAHTNPHPPTETKTVSSSCCCYDQQPGTHNGGVYEFFSRYVYYGGPLVIRTLMQVRKYSCMFRKYLLKYVRNIYASTLENIYANLENIYASTIENICASVVNKNG